MVQSHSSVIYIAIGVREIDDGREKYIFMAYFHLSGCVKRKELRKRTVMVTISFMMVAWMCTLFYSWINARKGLVNTFEPITNTHSFDRNGGETNRSPKSSLV